MKTVFLRVLDAEDKAAALLAAIREPERALGRQRFELDQKSLTNVPRSPFAYWVSESMRGAFGKLKPYEAEGRAARSGLATGDDFRWLRLWWESRERSTEGPFLVPFVKGGTFSPFYAPVSLAIRWGENGRWIREWKIDQLRQGLITPNNSSCWNDSHYFRPGLTWPARTQSGLALRAMPRGCIFAGKGPCAFVPNDDIQFLLALLSVMNSLCFRSLVEMQMAFGSFEVGVIQRTPLPSLSNADRLALSTSARRIILLKRSLDTCSEISHAFSVPALLQVVGADLISRVVAWSEHVRKVEVEVATIQAEIDQRCFALYDFDESDRRTIIEGFGIRGSDEASSLSDSENAVGDDVGENVDEEESTLESTGLAADLVSWAIGVAFGRFDVRRAMGAQPSLREEEPFDPLPVCSPGMLTDNDVVPAARRPAGYPLVFPESGVLVDDPGQSQDLTTAVRGVFDVVFGADADRWWNDVASLLDPIGHDFRAWFASGFFDHYMRRYSRSRRRAPILWQLGTPSGRYSVWLYAHRLTHDSFFQLQNEVVGPKLAHEERRFMSLMQNAGASPSRSERKEIAAMEAIVEELRAMLEEIRRVAPLWNPNLDDGVVLTMAPLWRLVPQHKSWQRELKTKWVELAAGKFDWAHIAMHIWPERVVPKCATDRSLAITHGLEDVFWFEGSDQEWHARETPTMAIDRIVRERTSSAVKAALTNLLDASVAVLSKGRSRPAALQ